MQIPVSAKQKPSGRRPSGILGFFGDVWGAWGLPGTPQTAGCPAVPGYLKQHQKARDPGGPTTFFRTYKYGSGQYAFSLLGPWPLSTGTWQKAW
jgi:hypothetical protein